MKKILSLVLVAVLAIGMSAAAFAAIPDGAYKVTGLTSSLGTSAGWTSSITGLSGTGDGDLDEVFPVDEVEVYVNLNDAALFDLVDKDDASVSPAVGKNDISKTLLTKGKVTVRTRYSKGKEAIDEVKLDTSNSRIKIIFNTEFTSTKDPDIEFTVYLLFDGKGTSDNGITFTGTWKNEVISFDSDTDYIYMSDQITAEADDSIRGVELDLGLGVKMKMNLTKGKKYYGIATQDGTDADMDLIAQYGFKEMYWLKTVNLSTSGNYVTLEELDRNDYVYGYEGGEFTFLGMGNETLPYYTKYFVSSTELDIGGGTDEAPDYDYDPDVDYGEPDIDGAELEPGFGGDDDDSDNINYNPSTGA